MIMKQSKYFGHDNDKRSNAHEPAELTWCLSLPQAVDHVYYETEYRTEWCQRNSTFSPCFLFARKFSKGAAMRLLVEGLLGDFDPGSLLSE